MVILNFLRQVCLRCGPLKARENNWSKTISGFLHILTGEKVLLHLLPTFLAGIGAGGGDSQLQNKSITAISLAQLLFH